MITREKIKKCAGSIVTGMNLKKGEAVVVRGGAHTQELLEEIGVLCYVEGAQPLIMSSSDTYIARVFDEIATDILEITPKHYLGAIKNADGYIIVEPFKDPNVPTGFSREKVAARTKANVPIRRELYGEGERRGKKWTYAGWPTVEAAGYYGIAYNDLESLIVEGMMVPSSTLKDKTSKLAARLKGKDVLRIRDEKGTDFTCKIKERRIYEDDGVIDDHDIEMNDLGNNLPAGEIFIPPHEIFGEGTLYCPITVDRFTHKVVKGATLHFKDGALILDECTADVNQDQMIDTFKRCIEIDRKEKEVRTTNIAELGIGCNPKIDKAIGYILTDEKLIGSVHVAFGSNTHFGGFSKSCLHWDFVSHPTATIEIVDTKEEIMSEGKIL